MNSKELELAKEIVIATKAIAELADIDEKGWSDAAREAAIIARRAMAHHLSSVPQTMSQLHDKASGIASHFIKSASQFPGKVMDKAGSFIATQVHGMMQGGHGVLAKACLAGALMAGAMEMMGSPEPMEHGMHQAQQEESIVSHNPRMEARQEETKEAGAAMCALSHAYAHLGSKELQEMLTKGNEDMQQAMKDGKRLWNELKKHLKNGDGDDKKDS